MSRPAASPSRRFALRAERGPAAWRWLKVAITLWLTLILAGREHVLSTIGLEIACIHPGEPAGAHASERDDHHGAKEAHRGGAPHALEEHAVVVHAALTPAPDDLPDDTSASDAEDADDCPVGCTGCACGAVHFSLPTSSQVATRTWSEDRPHRATRRDGPSLALSGLDRPPRRAS